jgi:ubiquitin-protein ligase
VHGGCGACACADAGTRISLAQTPNPLSPAHGEAYTLFTTQPAEYKKRILEQAKVHARLNAS